MNIGCIGSGAFGIAIATLLSKRKSNNVLVWTHDPNFKKKEKNFQITTDLKELVKKCDILFLLVSTPFLLDMKSQLQKENLKGKTLYIGTKGMLEESPYFFTKKLKKDLNCSYVGFFAGPNLASDLTSDAFCSMTFSYSKREMKKIVQSLFPENVILSFSKNENALELASTMKNIYAIGSGIIYEKTNSKSAVHTYLARSYNELMEILDTYFFLDYSFLPVDITGDFFLTGTMSESRNLSFGRSIVLKKNKTYLKENTVEGVQNIKSVKTYLKRKQVNAPIIEAIFQIVEEEKNISILENAIRKVY